MTPSTSGPHRIRRPFLRIVPFLGLAAALGAVAIAPSAVTAQQPTLIRGRVEDAATQQPVEGVRILNGSSTIATLTDADGTFSISLPAGDSLVLNAERIGYLSQHFVLPDDAPRVRTVLRLEPSAIVLEGVTAVTEAAIATLDTNLRNRRNAYGHALQVMDRSYLDRFAPIGTALDVIRRRNPRIRPCRSDPEGLCVPGRSRSPGNPFPVSRYSVCIDGWAAMAPQSDLGILDISSVALIEIFNGDRQIRVYTTNWFRHRANTGWTSLPPLWMGC